MYVQIKWDASRVIDVSGKEPIKTILVHSLFFFLIETTRSPIVNVEYEEIVEKSLMILNSCPTKILLSPLFM